LSFVGGEKAEWSQRADPAGEGEVYHTLQDEKEPVDAHGRGYVSRRFVWFLFFFFFFFFLPLTDKSNKNNK